MQSHQTPWKLATELKMNPLDYDGHESSTATIMVAETSRLSYDEVAEDIPSPDDPQLGIPNALIGGAKLEGLLTRRQSKRAPCPTCTQF